MIKAKPNLHALRLARIGAALAFVTLLAGCATEPRTVPDPTSAAAIARDGQRLFAGSSSTGDDTGRPGPLEQKAAARDDAPEEETR